MTGKTFPQQSFLVFWVFYNNNSNYISQETFNNNTDNLSVYNLVYRLANNSQLNIYDRYVVSQQFEVWGS